ncbi:hypothetical protein CR513_35609, partial [Mucuna pruriens]
MTWSNLGKLYAYDLEIDKTIHRLIRSPRSSVFAYDFGFFKSDIVNSNSDLGVPNLDFGVCTSQSSVDNMDDNNNTLKELITPNYGLIHLLPKFHDFVGEDSHKHLKEFLVVCSTMKPHGIPEDYIKMKAFPFSLVE